MGDFKKALRNDKMVRALATAELVLNKVVDVQKNFTIINTVHKAVDMSRSFLGSSATEFSSKSIFLNWNKVPLEKIVNKLVFEAISNSTQKVYLMQDDEMAMVELYDITIARSSTYSLYAPKHHDMEYVLQQMARLLIESTGPRYALSLVEEDKWSTKLHMEADTLTDLRSPMADQIFNRLSSFIGTGHSRSVLLYGPPGTGKSCIAMNLAQKVGGTCMRLPAAMAYTTDVPRLVKFLRPDVILIDDFFSVAPSAATLETLEKLKKLVKLSVVSTNTIEFAPALIRPGRFDEILEVVKPPPEVVNSLMGAIFSSIPALSQETVDRIHEWPLAFINELKERVEILGSAHFPVEFEKLDKRVIANDVQASEKEEKSK